MSKNNRPPQLESIDSIYETTLNQQFHRIYLDQKKRRKIQEKRRKAIQRWGYIISCCIL